MIVKGKTITIKVDGKETVTYTEPARRLTSGRRKPPAVKFPAAPSPSQAHDPLSVVHIKSIRVKAL